MNMEQAPKVEGTSSGTSALSVGLERTPSPEYLAFKAAGCNTVADKMRWDAAVAFEREACAKLAEAHFIFGHSVAGPHFASALADKIRKRSNA
jgi:hypothetical protein